jgi:cytochrome oxidase Cu insertion factor (SCO1/SenC/PrrC family)
MSGSKACALFVIACLFGGSVVAAERQSAAQMMDDLMYGRGSIGGPFTLTDQNGKRRSDAEFRGKLMIVYFGYTWCPDVCPADLMTITQALDNLGVAAEGIQPIFITIDPERDANALADYISAFHHSLIGLTGSTDEIQKVADAYKAFYVKVPDERSGGYSIDHSGVIYLMGRNGEYLGFMPPQTDPGRLTEILRKNLR